MKYLNAIMLVLGFIAGAAVAIIMIDGIQRAQLNNTHSQVTSPIRQVDFSTGDWPFDLRDIGPKFHLGTHTIMCKKSDGSVYFANQKGLRFLMLGYHHIGNGIMFDDTEGNPHIYFPFMKGRDLCTDLGDSKDA